MIPILRMAVARYSVRVFQLASLALAFASVGCGKVGCFEWTEAEGSCPSQEEALAYFSGGNCSSQISSVDSEPTRSGGYCCYDITKNDDDYYYDGVCSEGVGGTPPPSPSPSPPPSSPAPAGSR